MEKNKLNYSFGKKVIIILAGALLVGFMWHVRGQHGFGAKWGMFSVAASFMMFIYALYGERKNMNYEMIPLTAAFAAITAGGWGTLNSQIGGALCSNAYFAGEDVYRYTEISPWSGVAIMFLLGFGWLALFGIVLGSQFSKKKFEFKDFVIFVAVYYVTMILCNLTISHLVLKVINPQAVECAAEGIANAGYDLSPMKAFITKLGSASWAKPIPYCRNYFTSIKVISSAIGALVSSITVGVVLKDKFTAIFSTLNNIMCGIGITAASIVLAINLEERTVFTNIELPEYIAYNAWELWEYFTGFIFGLGMMIVIVCLPKKYTDKELNYEYSPLIKNKKFSIFYNTIFTFLFMFGVIIARAVSFRLPESFIDSEALEIILTIVLSVIAFIPIRKIVNKNMVEKNLVTPLDMPVNKFARKALPVYIGIIAVIFFFTGGEERRNILYLDFGAGFNELWEKGLLTEPILMAVTFVLMVICYYLLFSEKKAKVEK